MLARLVEKSLVAVEDGDRRNRYRLLETVRMYARAAARRGRRDDGARGAARALGARARRARARTRRGSTARRRTCASRSTRCSRTIRATRSASASRSRRSGCDGIELDEAKRRFAAALAAAPERTALRAEALLAAAAIDFRSGTLAARHGARRGEPRGRRRRSATRRAQWRALQFLGEFGVAARRRPTSRFRGSSGRSRSRAREGFAAAEAIGVHSLGVAELDARRPRERRRARWPRASRHFRALEGSPETIPSPLNIAEIRDSRAGQRGPGLQLVFEDTLQPFVEISCDAAVGYALANQAGDRARARRHRAAPHALLDESAARFEAPATTRRAWRPCSSAAPTSRSPRATWPRRAGSSKRRSSCVAAARPARPRLSCSPVSAWSRRSAGDYDAAERSPRRGARHLPARRRPVGAREHALADGRPRPRPRQPRRRRGRAAGGARRAGRDAARALDREHARRASPRSPSCAATSSRRRRCSPTRASRYAARDDALGVADVDERLAQLAKRPLRPRKDAAGYDSPARSLDERNADMTATSARVLGEATVQELRESRARRGRRRRPTPATTRRAGSGTAHTTAQAGARRPLRRRRRRDRRGRLRPQQRPADRRPRRRPQHRRLLDLRRRDRDRPLADERRSRRSGRAARDRRRRRRLGRRRPRDAGARARDDRRSRLVDRRRAASRSAAASAGRCGSSASPATTSSRPTSSPPTGGSSTRARPRTPTCSGACAAAAATSASSRSSSSTLHPLGPMVYAGPIFYPADADADLLRAFRDWAGDAPDEITALVNLTTAPPLPVIPAEWHGKKVAAFIAVSTGPLEEGEALVGAVPRGRPSRSPTCSGRCRTSVIQTLIDPLWPKGIHAYFKATNLARLDDELIERLCADPPRGARARSARSTCTRWAARSRASPRARRRSPSARCRSCSTPSPAGTTPPDAATRTPTGRAR